MSTSARGIGSVYQRSNGYWVTVVNAVNKDSSTVRKYLYSKTEKEAKIKLRTYCGAAAEKLFREEPVLIREIFAEWLETKRKDLKRSSYDRLESTVYNKVLPELGQLRSTNLNQRIIQQAIDKYTSSDSYSSVKKVYDAINACLKYACKRHTIKENPCELVKLPRRDAFDEKEIRILTNSEIAALKLEVSRSYKNGAPVYKYGNAFILALNTGLRLGELAGVKIGDIDLTQKVLRVRRNLSVVKNRDDKGNACGGFEFIEQSTKTRAGNRAIPLNDAAVACITALMGGRSNDKSYLLETSNGKHVSTTMLVKSFNIAAASAGIRSCGIHALRHTFATQMLRAGVDIKTVSELLGHSGVGITYNTYIHVLQEQKAAAVKLINL